MCVLEVVDFRTSVYRSCPYRVPYLCQSICYNTSLLKVVIFAPQICLIKLHHTILTFTG